MSRSVTAGWLALALMLCAECGLSAPSIYRIGVEDLLEISVWQHPELTKQLTVRPDGMISMPFAGELPAKGRTVEELTRDLQKALQGVVNDARVGVAVLTSGSNKIYVIGQVNKPGEYQSGRYLDVMQALSVAGGLTPFAAHNKIRILRRQGDTLETIPFDYDQVADAEDVKQNILLQGGDVVVVP